MTEEKEVAVEKNGEEKKEISAEDAQELENGIIRQVEYYFSDVNLPRDKFLREQVKLDDGWVPLDVLTRFNRLAKLSTDIAFIAKSLNNSTSGLLEVSDDNTKVRRNPENPLPEMNEDRRKDVMGRTIYAKGFPKDCLLDDLLKFFKEYETVENIIMRRYQDKQSKKRHFKGSIFATFKTKEQAVAFMDIENLKYDDSLLLRLWQEDYVQQKQDEYAAKKEKRDKKPKQNNEEKVDDFKLPTGTVLHFEGHDESMKREDVRDALLKLDGETEIAYIDYKLGDPEGWVRLTKENAAKEIYEKIQDGKLKIGDKEVAFKLLDDDSEKTYLEKTVEEMVKRRKNQKNNSRMNKGKNRGGGKQNRKRKQDHNDDGPPAKVKADDS